MKRKPLQKDDLQLSLDMHKRWSRDKNSFSEKYTVYCLNRKKIDRQIDWIRKQIGRHSGLKYVNIERD